MADIFWRLYRGVVRLFTGTGIGALPPIRALHNAITRRFKPETVVVHGFRMRLDSVDSLALAYHGVYEPFETELVKRYARPGAVALDIGANIGYYTLLMASIAGPEGRVYAFEPEPANYALLCENLRANNLGNVTTFQKAVSDREGVVCLSMSSENMGDHRIHHRGAGRRLAEVEAVTVDSLADELGGRLCLVKMDIQGAEGLALKGMQETLKRNPQAKVIMEFWPRRLAECGCDAAECLGLLEGLGFRFAVIDEKLRALRPETSRTLVAATRGQVNLLCSRDGETEGPGVAQGRQA
ncbi:MAG TPA: FkbM family methyltransferase [Candidatus Brocadiia bacterium]|nr:FkbM family methyltransferase [Candidatus Brocadiia bacterium]